MVALAFFDEEDGVSADADFFVGSSWAKLWELFDAGPRNLPFHGRTRYERAKARR